VSNHPFFIGVCVFARKHRAFHLGTIYLIRHGQAGTREHYDVLSALGERQAVLLGQHLQREAVTFATVYTGALRRQQQTAQLALQQMAQSVASQCDAQWNEFSLANVYRGMLPLLLRDDAAFAADYAAMQETLRADAHAVRGAVGRCDRAIIEAWMNERFAEYAGETWATFRARVQNALPAMLAAAEQQTIAVFTSATPIAIAVSEVLGVSNAKTLSLMAMVQNSSVTTLRVRDGETWLASFNALAHLPEPGMRTFR
jgi:broad specificity phosphatase PhoE